MTKIIAWLIFITVTAALAMIALSVLYVVGVTIYVEYRRTDDFLFKIVGALIAIGLIALVGVLYGWASERIKQGD